MHHLWPSWGQTGAPRQEEVKVQWFIRNIWYCTIWKESASKENVCVCVWWGVEGSVGDEPDWKLFMGQRGQAHPRRAPARILKFSLMSFCSPLMAAQLRQWEVNGLVGEREWSDLFYHHVALYGSYHWRLSQMLLSSGGRSVRFA